MKMTIGAYGTSLAGIALATLVLIGCKTIPTNPFAGADESSAPNTALAPGAKEMHGEAIREYLTDTGGRLPQHSRATSARDVESMRHLNFTPIRSPELEAYVNGVVERLISPLTSAGTVAVAYLLPKYNLQAYALPHGGIFVTLGAIETLDSEDELAALIAHEIAHVLYAHHTSGDIQDASTGMFGFAGLYHDLREGALTDDYRKLKVAHDVADIVVFPAWSRSQENEADRLGVDLLVNAGYDPYAMTSLMDKLAVALQRRREALDDKGSPFDLEGLESASTLEELRELQEQALKSMVERAKETLARQHDEAEKRRDAMAEYVDTVHFDVDPTRPVSLLQGAPEAAEAALDGYGALHTIEQRLAENASKPMVDQAITEASIHPQSEGPYARVLAFHEANQFGGRQDQIEASEAAVELGGVPFFLYQRLVRLQLEGHNYDQALATIESAEQAFTSTTELLPEEFQAHRALGNTFKALRSRAECMVSGQPSLIRRCELVRRAAR